MQTHSRQRRCCTVVQLYPIPVGTIFAKVDRARMLTRRQVVAARGRALPIAAAVHRQMPDHEAVVVDLHTERVVCAAGDVGDGLDLVGGSSAHLHAEGHFLRGIDRPFAATAVDHIHILAVTGSAVVAHHEQAVVGSRGWG